jgi:hypothetical protein
LITENDYIPSKVCIIIYLNAANISEQSAPALKECIVRIPFANRIELAKGDE